jgi:hypothetical protein
MKVKFHGDFDEKRFDPEEYLYGKEEWKWLNVKTEQLIEYIPWKFINLKYSHLKSFSVSYLNEEKCDENVFRFGEHIFYRDVLGYVYTIYENKVIYLAKSVSEFLSHLNFDLSVK